MNPFASLLVALVAALFTFSAGVPAARPWARRALLVAAILIAAGTALSPKHPPAEWANAAAR
jgi:hypothetical protein